MMYKARTRVAETTTLWKFRINKMYHLALASALALVCGDAIYDYLQGREGTQLYGLILLASAVLVAFMAFDTFIKHLDGDK